MTREVWEARFPDLGGKVALVTGAGDTLVAVVNALASNGTPLCIVATDRADVDAALVPAEPNGAMGIAAPPHEPGTWERVLPHAEQRLGPIDVLVAIGSAADRAVVVAAAFPDMAARRRGVIVEVGEPAPASDPAPGVRRRMVVADGETRPDDVASVAALCASDVLAASTVTIQLR